MVHAQEICAGRTLMIATGNAKSTGLIVRSYDDQGVGHAFMV